MHDKVYVVVLNWNGWSDTAVCLSSLRRLRYENYEVIVVDNGSTDDSCLRIRSEFPWVKLLEAGKNLGFAGGCNVGMRYALGHGADFIWLLNNDTIVSPTALHSLVDKANSNPHLGAVGSAIYFTDEEERLQAWGGGYVNFWAGASRHFREPVGDDMIEFLTGASMLISRKAIDSIGLLDEEFFMYWEDAAYCFHLRAEGWKLAVAEASRIWHKGSASVGRGSAMMDFYFNASAAIFFKRYSPAPFLSTWIGVWLRIGKRLLIGDWKGAHAVWIGATHKGSGSEQDPRMTIMRSSGSTS